MPNQDINNDLQGVSTPALKFNLWLVRHKILLENIVLATAITLLAILYIFNIWMALNLLVFDRESYLALQQNAATDYLNSAELRQKNSAQPIKIQGIKAVNSGDGLVDIIANIANLNERFVATEVLYRFVESEKVLYEGRTFVWPKQNKYVVAFNVPAATAATARLELTEVKWKRYFDFQPILSEKQNFLITPARYQPPQSLARGLLLGSVTFQVTNQTIYNFYEVGFYIVLFNGSEAVGAGFTRLETFESQQTEDISVGIGSTAPFVTSVMVLPEINILDESLYYSTPVELPPTLDPGVR